MNDSQNLDGESPQINHSRNGIILSESSHLDYKYEDLWISTIHWSVPQGSLLKEGKEKEGRGKD